MTLTGKRALVTGAAQGIGLAIAAELARQGAVVVIADRAGDKAHAAVQTLAIPGHAVTADVSTRDGCLAMAKEAATLAGGLDILVNNAGILHNASIENTTEEEWDRVMAINLKGVFFSVQAALPHLKESAQPRVVNVSSLAGRMGGYKTGLAYSASKGGVLALGMGLARQLAPLGITVNTICPGTTESDIIRAWSPETIESLRATIPLGRLGQPADIAAAVAFLASDAAGFITGACLDVNGGMFMG